MPATVLPVWKVTQRMIRPYNLIMWFDLLAVRISVPYTAEYSSNNTLCIDNNVNSPSAYRLEGCPDVFFDTYQGTDGVCVTTGEPAGTDILLTGNELPEGLQEFICFVNGTHSINFSAIVGK